MKRLVLLLSVACAFCATADDSAAQPNVTASNRSLAHTLAEELVGQIDTEDYARQLAERLLRNHAAWRGPPCAESAPACRNAAREVAREVAERQAVVVRSFLVERYAAQLRTSMIEEEMRAAIDQLQSGQGAALRRGLRTLLTINRQHMMTMMGAFAAAGAEERGATDTFYDRTEGLPRRVEPFPPPPPPPR